MRKVILAIGLAVGLLSMLPGGTIHAQEEAPGACGLGQYWLVWDDDGDSVWVRQADTAIFDAYWSALDTGKPATFEIAFAEDNQVVVRGPETFDCEYTGTIGANGVTVEDGALNCGSDSEPIWWTATIVCGTPVITWDQSTTDYRAALNQSLTFVCLPGGSETPIWGTDIYTSDSSVCTAAVHAGVITWDGGDVVVEVLPGQKSYQGRVQNEITSSEYGEWEGSFSVAASAEALVPVINWSYPATDFATQVGQTFTFDCTAETEQGYLWGSEIYTSDSAICVAAAHAGVITPAGGRVTLEILPKQESYTGSTQNDITSYDYGEYDSSFQFLQDAE